MRWNADSEGVGWPASTSSDHAEPIAAGRPNVTGRGYVTCMGVVAVMRVHFGDMLALIIPTWVGILNPK